MKKTILTLALVALSLGSSFGQGTVNFNNTATTFPDSATVDRKVYGPNGAALVGVNYAAALYFGSSADSINNLATLNATDTSITGARGLFRVATTLSPGTWSGGARTLLGTQPGELVFLQVRVWDISLFANYGLAVNAGGITGASDPFQYRISTSPTPPPSDLVMLNLRSFQVVPEPSTIALGVLGLGSLLLFRRKKA